MSHELICAWLGLPAEPWPPDHYSLLGLTKGESDPKLIEERVHQQLDTVRRYQMIHPEPATEAMNRIAQAFVCLSEPASKRVYDVALLGTAAVEPSVSPQAASAPVDPLTAGEDRDPLVLVYNPTNEAAAPPIRVAFPNAEPPPIRVAFPNAEPPPIRRPAPIPQQAGASSPDSTPTPDPTAVLEAIPVATEVVAVPVAEIVEPIVVAVPVQHGPDTKRQVYRRIVQTRHLLDRWNKVGKYLATPKKRLTRVADIQELLRQLNEIRTALKTFPPPLGEPGQHGYAVVALTQLPVGTIQTLTLEQRDGLSRDWQNGKQLLESKRESLRQEARAMRKRPLGQRLTRYVRTSIVEHPGPVLIALALLAVVVAIWRSYG